MNKYKQLLLDIKRSKWTILFIVIWLILIGSFFCEKLEFKAFVAYFSGVLTAYFGILKQTMDDDKVFRELFLSFNSRYNDQTNDLLNELSNGNYTIKEKDKLMIIDYFNPDLTHRTRSFQQDKLMIIDYFNLCSEEYLWYTKGRIPSMVWKAWEAGIVVNLSIPIVNEVFISETKDDIQRSSYYGFAEYITPKIKEYCRIKEATSRISEPL